jgi:hypothetical protein
VNGKKIAALAYRNNGSVTLGSSTVNVLPTWDLVLKHPRDRERMKSEEWRKTSWYAKPIKESVVDADDRELFDELEITPKTTPGTSAAWFCIRGYSFGSSTSDAILNAVKKHPEPSIEEDNEEDNAIIAAAKPILTYIGNNSNVRHEEEQSENEEEEEEGDEPNLADQVNLIPQADIAAGEEELQQPNDAAEDEEVEIPNMNYEHGSIEHVKYTLRQIQRNPTEMDYVSALKFDIDPELSLDDERPIDPIIDEVRSI